MKYLVVIFLSALCGAFAKKLPSSFSICKRNDPALNECFSKAVETALKILKEPVPELSIPTIEPIRFPLIEADPVGSKNFGFNHKVMNVEIGNMANSVVESTDLKLGDKDFSLKIHARNPLVNIAGDYELKGKVLLLPVNGKGPFSIALEDVKLVIEISGQVVERNGKKYLASEKSSCLILPQNAKVRFENLFDGNQELSESTNGFFNENWREIYNEIRSTYENAVAQFLKQVFQQVFSKVPFDNLFPQ